MAKRKAYRFAVIGYGGRGRGHGWGLENVRGARAECVAVCDVRTPTDEEKAKWGDRFYADYRDLLRSEELDFVVVASQETQHVEHSLAALRKGLPVYLEKAVSNTWTSAVKLYREVKRHNYPLFVGYNLRRFPAALAVTKLLRDGKIGFVQSVLGHVNTGCGWGSNVMIRLFYGDAERSGDIVLSKLTHDTDWVQHALGARAATCTGMVTRNVWTLPPHPTVDAAYLGGLESLKTEPTSHDTCCATGIMDNGTAYTFLFTTAGPDYERRYVFNGTRGQIDAVLHHYRPGEEDASVTLWPCGGKPKKIKLPLSHGGHGGADPRTHRDFMDWFKGGANGPHEAESILQGMLIPTAVLESARTGRSVDCAARLQKALKV